MAYEEDEAWDASGSDVEVSEEDEDELPTPAAASRSGSKDAEEVVGDVVQHAVHSTTRGEGGCGEAVGQKEAPAARPAAAAGPAAPGMATLIGHLRCDNLKLRGALIEAQREVEGLTLALEEKEEERCKLAAELAQLKEARQEKEAAKEPTTREVPAPKEEGQKAPVEEKEKTCLLEEKSKLEQEKLRLEQDKLKLESQLVRSKMQSAEAQERAESMEHLINYYEDQLVALNPQFRSVAAATRSGLPPLPSSGSAHRASRRGSGNHATGSRELAHEPSVSHQDSGGTNEGSGGKPSKDKPPPAAEDSPKKKKGVKKLVSGMFKPKDRVSSHHRSSVSSEALGQQKVPTADEDAQRQKQVIACLMAELDKANRERQELQARLTAPAQNGDPAEESV